MKLTDNKKFPLEASLVDRYRENPEGVFKSSHQKVNKSRETGLERFNKIGLPTTKLEQWRSTNLSKNYNTAKRVQAFSSSGKFDKANELIFLVLRPPTYWSPAILL